MRDIGYTVAVPWANGTSITYAGPWHQQVSARVLCPDGKVRKVKRIGQPDTAFSIPAAVSAYGRTVTGFITVNDDTLRFLPYEYRANAWVFRDRER